MYPPSPRVVAGLLLMAALDARAEPDTGLLVRVRVTDVAYTDYYPADDCPPEQECIVGNTWFRYDAKVREVIRGRYSQPTLQFANLQHAYFSRKPHDWFVWVVPCAQGVIDALHVEYCVRDHAFANDRVGRQRLMEAQHGA